MLPIQCLRTLPIQARNASYLEQFSSPTAAAAGPTARASIKRHMVPGAAAAPGHDCSACDTSIQLFEGISTDHTGAASSWRNLLLCSNPLINLQPWGFYTCTEGTSQNGLCLMLYKDLTTAWGMSCSKIQRKTQLCLKRRPVALACQKQRRLKHVLLLAKGAACPALHHLLHSSSNT